MALKFPADLTDRYYLDMKFKTYSRPSPYDGKISLSESNKAPAAAISGGAIRLPVPANLVDAQKLVWKQEENLDGAAGVVFNAATGNLGGAGAGLITGTGVVLDNIVSEIRRNFGGLGKAAGSPTGYSLQMMGLALNPVLTQTFKHPEFKEHHFSWTLAPESSAESYILQQIIDTVKEQSLPDINGGGALFSYPAIVMVEIHTGNNGKLYNFQPCVITSVVANYAPRGVPAFFGGTNAPAMVKLDISLLEIILNTRSNMNGENVSGFDFSMGGIGNDSIRTAGLAAIRRLL